VFLIRCQKRVIYRNGMELGERVKTSEMEINQTCFQLFYYLLFNRKREPYFNPTFSLSLTHSPPLQQKQAGAYRIECAADPAQSAPRHNYGPRHFSRRQTPLGP
jgi:hypothetical protein